MGAEASGGNRHTGCLQSSVQILPDALGVLGFSRSHEAGTVAVTKIRVKSELGDGKDGAAAVQDRPVHPALLVGEDAHPGQLADGIVHLVCPVAILDGYQEHEPHADALGFKIGIRPPLLIDHIDPGTADPLYDDSHGFSLRTSGVVVVSLGKAGSVSGWGQAGEPFEDAHEIFGVVISAGFGYLSDAHGGRQEQLLSSFDADPPDLSGDTDAEPPLIDGRQVRGRIVEVFCYAGNTDPVAGVDTDPILDLLEGAILVVSFLTVLGRGPSHGDLHEQAGHEIAAVGAGIRVGALVDVKQLVEHDGQPIVVCQTKIQG